MNKFIIFLSIISLFFISGCATKPFEPFNPEPIKFEKTEPYKVNVQKLDDVVKNTVKQMNTSIKFGVIDQKSGNVVITDDIDQANIVVLSKENYAKFADLMEAMVAYKQVIDSQSVLINEHIMNVNNLKELAEIERSKVKLYRDMWVDSENMYREERRLHKRDEVINKVEMIGSTIVWGGIVVAILAL